MRILMVSIFITIFLSLVYGFLLVNQVEAGNCAVGDTACDVARIQGNMADYNGPVAPTTDNMVCLHVVAYEPSSLVIANGDQPVGAVVAGHVVTSWRVQRSAWKPWPRDPRYVYREICFGEALLHQSNNPHASLREALTLCNGEYLNEPLRNRSVWRERKGHLSYLSKVKRIEYDDPACLLGKIECARFGL